MPDDEWCQQTDDWGKSAAKRKDVVDLDRDEIACRILESMLQKPRFPGKSATDMLELMEKDVRDNMRRAALSVMNYVHDQFAGFSEAQLVSWAQPLS